ncbi:MAG: pirin family protein [Cellvibrio sp.]|uniref:pirin family protein n=1 Tax=Cellvibrio sp. TaxID=1965322 RepID=UPI0027215830|nr:pirin family protein [Cellvibrio sp.]
MTNAPHSLYPALPDAAPDEQDNLLCSLSDWARLQPFVSLRLLTAQTPAADARAASGKAIITYVLAGDAAYADSTGKRGTLHKSAWVWMIAGSGLCYSIAPLTHDFAAIEVCIALSPALENSPPQSAYQSAVPTPPADPVQVLIGWHDKNRSQFAAPSQVNYFLVQLSAQQRWCYELPLNHQLGWAALISGRVQTAAGALHPKRVSAFHRPGEPIEFHAQEDSILVLGSAMEFGYDLITHAGSVHTSREALQQGLQGIAAAAKTHPHLLCPHTST